MKGRNSDVSVCVMGELDAVICRTNPDADEATGAAHACGHNAQIASMLGAAIGLSEIKDSLDGDVVFFAVPAEEFVELSYREGLAEEGRIKYLGGKQELIRIGAFDDVDMAMMVHSHGNSPEALVSVGGSSLGFVAKTVEFKGKAAHGSTPYDGVNALNAATAALMCIHAQRETFRDEDKIRIHPIITNGGELVNIVPANVTMETYVRGANFKAIKDASMKVDRAIEGASYAVGAKSEIKNFKGYLPLMQDPTLSSLFKENAKRFVPEDKIYEGINMIGSSDVGDLSHIIPTIQPTMGGFYGAAHSQEFKISSDELAYLQPAKIMALTVIDLLFDGACLAKKIKSEFTPLLTKEEYYNI
jgi:amidohydrolase